MKGLIKDPIGRMFAIRKPRLKIEQKPECSFECHGILIEDKDCDNCEHRPPF